jgi:hypothetical protein
MFQRGKLLARLEHNAGRYRLTRPDPRQGRGDSVTRQLRLPHSSSTAGAGAGGAYGSGLGPSKTVGAPL